MAEENSAEVKQKTGFDFKIVLAGLVIFLVAMGASYFILHSLIAPLVPEENNQPAKVLTGNLVSLGEFTTNVTDVAGTRFLKAEVYVEVTDKKTTQSLDEYMPVMQDSVLTILSSKTVADLDVRSRDNLKEEIRVDLNHKVGKNAIKSVYFTSFIMQ